ncbi:MAG TPA: hypothetical protein VKT28_02595 [Puia sp.]|nr:hypothetical protein [Puia sp.]
MTTQLRNEIFKVSGEDFEQLAIDVFHSQYQHNLLYKSYVNALKINIENINSIARIPFLPISFFKTHDIKTGSFDAEIIFESSGTTQTINSRHYVKNISLYRESFIKGFEKFYGPINDWCIIGLLPSYLERKNSSLIMMVDELIKISNHPQSGFYLYEHDKLNEVLHQLENKKQKALLMGVTFALLDFAENFPQQLKHTIVMETGGMKGRRKELTRKETHEFLKNRLGINVVHSEYGMTELLSQAYSKGEGRFESVPWMKTLVRNEDDPFDVKENGSGIINIIDLANIYSCSFIATEDVGNIFEDGSLEIAGRVDNSDIRGCSLLVV